MSPITWDATILEIYNEVVLNSMAVYEERPRTLEQQHAWFRDKLSTGYPVFVGVINEKVVGYSGLSPFRAWHCYRSSVELGLHVSADHRGQGIGTKLLEHLIEKAKAMGLHAMIAGIDSTNHASLTLHKKAQFLQVGLLPQIASKKGQWLDLVFMQRIL